MLVEINLDMPLLRGTKLKLGTECVWVEFRYEKVPTFCFYCGIIGHSERICLRKVEDAKENKVCEGQYGEWRRAVFLSGGRRGDYGETSSRNKPELQLTPVPDETDPRGANVSKAKTPVIHSPGSQQDNLLDTEDRRINGIMEKDKQTLICDRESS